MNRYDYMRLYFNKYAKIPNDKELAKFIFWGV